MTNGTHRSAAHAALTNACEAHGLAESETMAHGIIDTLCDIVDAVAKQAAAQELQHQRHIRGLGVGSWEGITGPSRSRPPSNETESERLHERQTLALESIAKSFAKFNGRGEP